MVEIGDTISRISGMEDLPCPLCGADVRTLLYRNARQSSGLGEIPVYVVQCDACGFLYTAPRPDQAARDTYYAGSALASGQVYRDESAAGLFPRLYAQRADFLAGVLGKRRGGSLLDVGCGNGGFLRALAAAGLVDWQLRGLEPSQHAVATCCSHGLDVVCGGVGYDAYAPGSFDAITMISVLEHLPDPLASLHWCRRLLKPDGVLFLEVPDNLQPELSLTSHFNVEHIMHFTPWTLQQMLMQAGFFQRLRDGTARGVIRQASAASLDPWERQADPACADDRAELRRVVGDYALAERQLVDGVCVRVEAALARWHAVGRRVAIYGAGLHSAQLGALVDLPRHVTCFIDGDPAKQGTTFLGLPVYAPEHLPELCIGAVLISSCRFVDEMVHKVASVCGEEIEIASCYA